MRHFFNITCNTFFNIILHETIINVDNYENFLWEPKQHAHKHTCSAAHPRDACYQEVW